ncbi:MAG: pseudouridine synthase [Bacillota bacterium]
MLRSNDAPGEMRLDSFLSRAGVTSRRRAQELIRRGRVSVDGRRVTEAGHRVLPGRSEVRVDGKVARVRQDHLYLKMHKPRGCLTATRDPRNRPTVMGFLPPELPRVFPVGRLDFDSSGLLLLTSDGSWAQRVAHPSSGVRRVYRVRVQGCPGADVLRDLQEGIELADGRAAFDRVQILSQTEEDSHLKVVLGEGRYREIRRMMATVGHPVISVERISLGGVRLGSVT